MRNRLEDLGRLLVLIEQLTDDELFDNLPWRRPKDAIESFSALTPERQADFIHSLAYRITDFHEKLVMLWEIAAGQDNINQLSDKTD